MLWREDETKTPNKPAAVEWAAPIAYADRERTRITTYESSVEGILSDAFVHFTPEYVGGRGWREMQKENDKIHLELPYVETDQRIIEREFVVLGGIHARILDLEEFLRLLQ